MPRIPIATVLGLMLALVVRAESASPFSEKQIQGVIESCKGEVESETGTSLDPLPFVCIPTIDDFTDKLAQEFLAKMADDDPPSERQARARQTASSIAPLVLAHYMASTNTIYVLRENYERVKEVRDETRLSSGAFLRATLIHELTHAADQKKYGALDQPNDLMTDDQVFAWKAVLEGHAQYVTGKVLRREAGGDERFKEFVRVIEYAPNADATLTGMLEAYHDGLAFFAALEKTETGDISGRVFADPPASRSEIQHPEKWIRRASKGAPANLGPLLESLKRDAGKGWSSSTASFSADDLRKSMETLFTSERLGNVAEGIRGGRGISFTSVSEPHTKTVITIQEAMNESGAELAFNLQRDAMKLKDYSLEKAGIKLAQVTYGELKLKAGLRSVDAQRTVVIKGESVKLREVHVLVGRFSVGILWSNQAIDDKEAEKLVQKMIESLEKN